MSELKKRVTIILDYDIFDKFKELAKEQNRTPGNLGTTLVNEYVKNNYKEKK